MFMTHDWSPMVIGDSHIYCRICATLTNLYSYSLFFHIYNGSYKGYVKK